MRNQYGSQTAEFAVAMGVLLLLFFFPLIDLISIGVSYGLCGVLNSNQAREASLLKASEANDGNGLIRKGLPDQWLSGMGKFVKIVGYPDTAISYRDGQSGDKIVLVATTVTCSPFLPIPFPIGNIPGLNGPMTFTVASEKPMENPDYAGLSVATSNAQQPAPPPPAPVQPAPVPPPAAVPASGPAGPGGPGGPQNWSIQYDGQMHWHN